MGSKSDNVSVIIPMFNAERFISDALDSVLSQTITPGEVIIVDDGSEDDGVAVVAKFEPAVKIVSQENAGAASARQAGANLAAGRLLAFLDADDMWVENALQVRLEVMNANPAIDAVFGGVEQFICETAPQNIKDRGKIFTEVEGARHPGCMLIKAEVYRAIGGFNPEFRTGEALDFVSRLDAGNYVSHMMPDLIMRRRIHGSNTVLSAEELHKAYLRALRERIRRKS